MCEGKATISVFEFDDNALCSNPYVKVKIFEDYSTEWAEFILQNRRNEGDQSILDFDIVIGPIADDSVGVQLRRFMMGYISIETMIEELRFRGDKTTQYFFGTQRAITLLKHIGYER